MKKLYFLLLTTFLLASSLSAQPKDTLLVGYKVSPPFVYEENGQPSGPSVWLWENIAKQQNIHYSYQKMPLDSILWSLENNTIDLCVSPLTITGKRAQVIDFSSPFYIAHSSLMQKSISTFERTFAFISSFFSSHFLRAAGALAFIILIFGLLVWLFERKQNKEEFGKGVKGLWNGFWWSAVTMTTVGYGDKSPKTIGGRIVALVWMFTAIIIISGFTASIASSLTVNKIDTAGGNIHDFKTKTLGTIGQSDTDDWLKNNFFKEKNLYKDMPSLLEALDKGDIDAIAYDRPILTNIIAHDSTSSYTLIDTKYNPQFYAIAMSKKLDESIKSQINLNMLNIIEKMEWKVLLSEYNLE